MTTPTASSQWNYQVTAQKPTAVTHAVTGRFTGPDQLNLLIAKCTTVEIHLMTAHGLAPVVEFNVYGRIAVMQLYRLPEEEQDLLFILTERNKFCVLSYDPIQGEIVTRAGGDTHDRIGHATDVGPLGVIDPECRMIGLHIYTGLFKVIPIDARGNLQEAFNIRLEELEVIDIKFLYGTTKPTIAVLYQDSMDFRNVKTYEVSKDDKDFSDGPWQQDNIEASACMLIPVPAPAGGVVIVGETTLAYHNGTTLTAFNMPKPTIMQAYGRIDDNGYRYILGDHVGMLFVLLLDIQDGSVNGLSLEPLGETSISSCVSYLDNGVVFVGSSFGDSQLVRLKGERDATTDSYIEVLDTFTNLGPIVDFCIVDLERQGQGQIVTCSGAYKDGSLRVIRNGIGINEVSQLPLPGVKGVWSLRASSSSEYDKYLAIAFTTELRLLAISEEEMEEAEISGFEAEGSLTLYVGNAVDDQFIQVTQKAVLLVNAVSFEVNGRWDPPEGMSITLAAANESQVLVATGGGNLVYIEVNGNTLNQVAHKEMEHEIACLDCSPLGGVGGRATVCAVGLWTDISARVLTLPGLEPVAREVLGENMGIPRSTLFAWFEGTDYLLIGMGDGHFFSFVIDPASGALSDRKMLTLGTQPVLLSKFNSSGTSHVFAASDRPTVVYSSNKKLLFSNVNLRDVTYVCPFNSEEFNDCLVLASESALTIGAIDEIQKLHKVSVPLGEMPRRLCYHEPSRTFAVLCAKFSVDASGEEVESNFVRVFDDSTFELTSSFSLDKCETGASILSLTMGDSLEEYVVVGTGFAHEKEPEPQVGRILVFRIAEQKLELVHEMQTKGAVYCLNAFNGKLLAGINSGVNLYTWVQSEDGGGAHELVYQCCHHGHIVALYLRSRGEFIVVGDLMKSISLLVYKPIEQEIEEIAHDYTQLWMSDVEILDDDTFLGAENAFNIFTVRKNSDAATDEERGRLEVVGEYHLGEFVNAFRHGSLVMTLPDSESKPIPTVIYATTNGAIGVIASLTQEDFDFFHSVQDALNKVIKGVGGLKHSEWRSFDNDLKTRDARNFVDGDLVEAYLDLPPDKMATVAEYVNMVPEDLAKRIEELARRLH